MTWVAYLLLHNTYRSQVTFSRPNSRGFSPMPSQRLPPKDRDPRFITIRRGGTLTDSDHRLLALWAAACRGARPLPFGSVQPSDPRPRQAVEQARHGRRRGQDVSVPRRVAMPWLRQEG